VAPPGGPPPPSLDLPAVAVEIVRRLHAGLDRFHIRLDPPELGRIEVRLDIDRQNVAVRLTVDRPETLDLLQRDAKALERALGQAGLSGDRTSLEFALRQNPPGHDSGGRQSTASSEQEADAAAVTPPDPSGGTTTAIYRASARPGGIDLYA